MRFLNALGFLTVIRLRRRDEIKPEDLGRSLVCFPVVGLIIGLILAGLYWLLAHVLPMSLVSGILIVASVVLSGGLHLDGFVDTCDGIGGHKSPEDRWRVMRDSRAGAFGIIGAVCLILVKYLALNSIPQNLMMSALVLMPVMGRWAMVYAVFAYPYARPSGLGSAFKAGADRLQMAAATLIAAAVALVWFGWVRLVIMGGVLLAGIIAAAYFRRKFTGLTGDTYGAINEIAEVTVLILVTLLVHNQWLGLG